MSLFKSREWWITHCGTEEIFEASSLLVSKLNSNHDYAIVGSHSGFLRIYQPGSDKTEDGLLHSYRPTDLIIESQLSNPVLQIKIGKLVSGSQILQLAILHPRSVGIYSLVTKSGVAEHGSQNSILLVYEHVLKRTTFSISVGPFGGSQHRDFMCIQSLDGMLTFFEQEIFSFCCFLPEFLLPGPLVYIKCTDSFVTIHSNWNISSYTYKRLSENGHNSIQTDTVGTKFDADWFYNIGENILDMSVVETEANETSLVILGEKNLYCLTDTGKLKFMKRFDFSPQCFQPFYIRANSKLMTLIVTETSTLLVYDNATLRWSAQLSFQPIAISRGFFGCISGALVFLSENGLLQLSYLGTEPQLFTAPPLQNQELDFEKAEQELNTLNKIIKSNRNNDIALANAATERELKLSVNINPHLEPCNLQNEILLNPEEISLLMCLITVDLLPNSPFEEVQISLIVEPPLETHPNIHFVSNLEEKESFNSSVYLRKAMQVASLELKVIVSHITTSGVPRILKRSVNLPLKLVMTADTPAKDAAHKITLNINDQPVPLSTLFPEYAGEASFSVSSSAVGFKNIAGVGSPVTILLAKNSLRYRLQSDSITSLNLLVEQLILRLEKHFEKNADFKVSSGSAPPIIQFLEVIEKHFSKRVAVTMLQNQLSEYAAQFRLIQKRLITKFKDKNPTPLNNLDILMYETHSEISKCSDKYQEEKEELQKIQCELSSVIRMIMCLVQHSEASLDNFKIVNSMFVTPVTDIDGQGWEDIIEACISHLLRTTLSKSEKDRIKNISNNLEQIKDIHKFKKRVGQIIDRMTKISSSSATEIVDNDENLETKEASGNLLTPPEALTQVGSKYAVSSARVQSAKMRTSKLMSTPEEVEGEEV